jgi:hypothetical protein
MDFNPNMRKHHSGAFLRNGKIVYQMRTHYARDRRLDKLLNPLTEDELAEVVKSWTVFEKMVIKCPIDIFIEDLTKLHNELLAYQDRLTKYRTPLIAEFYKISEDSFPFTDHRDNHVRDLISECVQDQLERRNLRRIFGKKAETLYSKVFKYEVIKPK